MSNPAVFKMAGMVKRLVPTVSVITLYHVHMTPEAQNYGSLLTTAYKGEGEGERERDSKSKRKKRKKQER